MRWLKFNAVGIAGVVVQAGALAVLVHVVGLEYLLATVLAVETAVLHNFVWHRKWTWADRHGRAGPCGPALLRFNLTAGGISLAGNVLLMQILVGIWRLNPLLANLLSIASCSLVTYLLSDRLVFVDSATLRAVTMEKGGDRHRLGRFRLLSRILPHLFDNEGEVRCRDPIP